MCGYCAERNFSLPLWQNGRFTPFADIDALYDHSYSIESPNLNSLCTQQRRGQPLDAAVVLMRLACKAHTQPLNNDEQQLKQAMLSQWQQNERKISPSQWPALDEAITHIFNACQLPYQDHQSLPAEFTEQLTALLSFAAERFYPPRQQDDTDADTAEWDESEHQRLLAHSNRLTREFYALFNQLYLAVLLMIQLQPQQPALQHIALNDVGINTMFPGYELALRRLLQCHCIQHYGHDWFWQNLDNFSMEQMYYMASRMRFCPGDILALQMKIEDEYAGIDFYMTRTECVAALNELSLAIEFGFDEGYDDSYS